MSNDETVPGVKFTWNETVRREAFLSMDEAREAYGLGGTPDNQVIGRINLLTQHDRGLFASLYGDQFERLAEPVGMPLRSTPTLASAQVAKTGKRLARPCGSWLTGVAREETDPDGKVRAELTIGLTRISTDTIGTPAQVAAWLRQYATDIEQAGS